MSEMTGSEILACIVLFIVIPVCSLLFPDALLLVCGILALWIGIVGAQEEKSSRHWLDLLTQAQQGKRFRRTVLASLGFVMLSLFSLPVVTTVERIFEAFSQKGIEFWMPLVGCSYVLMILTLLLLRNNSSAFSCF